MHFLTLAGLAGITWAITTTTEKHYLLKKSLIQKNYFFIDIYF